MSRGWHEVTEQPAGVTATLWGKDVSVPGIRLVEVSLGLGPQSLRVGLPEFSDAGAMLGGGLPPLHHLLRGPGDVTSPLEGLLLCKRGWRQAWLTKLRGIGEILNVTASCEWRCAVHV